MKKKRKSKVVKLRPERRLPPWSGRKCPKCGSIRMWIAHAGSASSEGCYDCRYEKKGR